MRKYLPIAGVIVLGVAVALVIYIFGTSQLRGNSGDRESESPRDTAKENPAGLVQLSATEAVQAPSEQVVEEKKEEKPVLPESIAELQAFLQEKPEDPLAEEAVKKLVSKYREQGMERQALTLELERSEDNEREKVLAKIESLNKALMSPRSTSAETETYLVKSGDTLSKIGRHFKIPAELIMRLNGLKSDLIQIGQKLRVVKGPFSIKVNKQLFRLTVFWDRGVFKEYKIGLGVDGSTPVGHFKVESKVSKPTWYDQGAAYDFGDPHNPLGTRWIAFKGPYGIHGTWENDSIGKERSRGCIRMRNEDVEEVFDLVVPGHSEVIIE